MEFLEFSAAIVATFVLGSTMAQAATLFKDGDTAISIEGLDLTGEWVLCPSAVLPAPEAENRATSMVRQCL